MKITPTGETDANFPAGDRVLALMMSGGVDSSAAALLLRRRGWNIVGFTLRIPSCGGNLVESGESAAAVAAGLGIPHYVVHAESAFEERVVAPFKAAYLRGVTPNPCADCNKNIKFGLLMDAIDEFAGRSLPIATGHYARVAEFGGLRRLARARNSVKDQSYFLCDVESERFSRVHFPLGDFSKGEVRALARDEGLSVADRPESMEVCFVAGEDYRSSLFSGEPGDIVMRDGRVLARHRGIGGYTVGQRKGLGIAFPEPLYVLKLDVERNAVVVGVREHAYTRIVRAERPNILAPERLEEGSAGTRLWGKTRSRSPLAACSITALGESLEVEFDEPEFAPAAGQRLALYDADEVLVVSGRIV